MPIDIEWQDERGQRLRRYEGPDLTMSALDIVEESGTCVRFIDPHGVTIFNQLQLPVLMAELETAALEAQDPGHLAVLRTVLEFLEQGRGERHTYVRFFGD
jgi:hypothetical protein